MTTHKHQFKRKTKSKHIRHATVKSQPRKRSLSERERLGTTVVFAAMWQDHWFEFWNHPLLQILVQGMAAYKMSIAANHTPNWVLPLPRPPHGKSFSAKLPLKRWHSYTFENERGARIYKIMFIFHSFINRKETPQKMYILITSTCQKSSDFQICKWIKGLGNVIKKFHEQTWRTQWAQLKNLATPNANT